MLRRPGLPIALTAVVLAAGSASAFDFAVTGKKLLIKNSPSGTASNKLVHLSKDSTLVFFSAGSGGDPQCTGADGGGTSSVRIAASGSAGDITIPLPCTGWTTNGANNLYKYKDPTGATCRLVLLKQNRLLKAVCKGSQVNIDLNGSMSPVAVVTTLNGIAYCTEFGGTVVKDGSDDATFLRKDSAAPSGCPGPPSPTTTSTSSTTSTTGVLTPCGNTEYPTCGGACPAGQTCQAWASEGATQVLMCPCGGYACGNVGGFNCCAEGFKGCVCVDANVACGATTCPDVGTCSPGETCRSEVGDFFCGNSCTHGCCVSPGQPCTLSTSCCFGCNLSSGVCDPLPF